MCKFQYFLSISILFFLQSCSNEMQVDCRQLQIDTVKSSYTYKKEFVEGVLRLKGDTVYSKTSGKALFCVESGQIAAVNDTILIIERNNFYGNENQNDYLLKRLASLQVKTHHLKGYLLKHSKSGKCKVSTKNVESMPDMEVSYGDNEQHDYEGVVRASAKAKSELKKHNNKMHLLEKIERLNKEIQRIEKQISQNTNDFVKDYIQIRQTGHIQYLVSENHPFKPGTPLFRVEASEANQFIVHLEETPQENWLPEVDIFAGQKKLQGKLTKNIDGGFHVEVHTDQIKKDLAGQPVTVKLCTKPQKKLLLKKPALNSDGDNNWVFCRKGDEFRKVQVKIKPYSGAMVEIISGIHENDQIIVSSSLSIWNKDRLKVKSQYAKN